MCLNSSGVIFMNGLYIDTMALLIHRSIGPNSRFGGFRRGLHLVELADIGRHRQRLAAARFDIALRAFQSLAAAGQQARLWRRARRTCEPSRARRRPMRR